MYKLYGIINYTWEDGNTAERKDYGTYATYEEAMKIGCKLVWTGKANSYEILAAK
jgi:hypothetical protein